MGNITLPKERPQSMETLVTTLKISRLDEVDDAAMHLLEICDGHKIFALYGAMGAGKTTLVKALCKQLGSDDVVKSPTFAIVNEYDSPQGSIFHFDFYRIKDLSEVFDLGFEEYISSGSYCFLEWPELIEPLVPEQAAILQISATGPEERLIKIALR